jgi:hypothetical protein
MRQDGGGVSFKSLFFTKLKSMGWKQLLDKIRWWILQPRWWL